MKLVFAISLVCLGCFVSFSQNDSLQFLSNNYQYNKNPYNDYFKRVTFKIGGGAFLPQGELKTYFKSSLLLELSLDFPVTDKKSLEVALQFVIPKQNAPFEFSQNANDVLVESSLIFNPMLRFKKDLGQSDFSKFTLGLGVGASVITSSKNVSFSNNETGERFEITTFLLSPSLDYVKTFKNKEQLTFSFGLQYSPYKIRGATQEEIGSIALTPRVLYSF